jgi:GNAT acetyltransferase
MNLVDCPPKLAQMRLEALYRYDHHGRMLTVNEWDGGAAPRFHLMRTARASLGRVRSDLPDDVAARLEELCANEIRTYQGELPALHDEYLELLSSTGPVVSVLAGPVFVFPIDLPSVRDTVSIAPGNANRLRDGLEKWLPDVPHRQPFKAVALNGRAVSICCSVRISDAVHCAGVETVADLRRQGHAANAVTSWALAVKSLGATPFYSTSWENEASRSLAARLGLALVGVDFRLM